MINSAEFTELYAYSLVEGLPGDNWPQAGEICAAVANSQRSKGKAAQRSDYMPKYKPATMTADNAEMLIRGQASIVNGRRVR